MLALMVCAAVGFVSDADGSLDRGQTVALLRQLRSPLLDYECLYEGTETKLRAPDLSGLPEPMRKATERNPASQVGSVIAYQGRYAFRSDKSIHMDVSVRQPVPTLPMQRQIFCLFRNKAGKRTIVADRGGVTVPDFSQAAGTIFMKKTYSLLRLDMFPYLIETLNVESNPFGKTEWTIIDGHRCLMIDIPRLQEDKSKRQWGERFWVDVDRGGCITKYEWDENDLVTARLAEVMLSEATVGVWLPISGTIQFFGNGFKSTKEAQSQQTYAILGGSLKVNLRLPDSRFTLDYGLDEAMLASARKANSPSGRNKTLPSLDAVTRTKAMLKDPDDPSQKLVAQPVSSVAWIKRNAASVAVITLGASLLVLAYLWKRRSA